MSVLKDKKTNDGTKEEVKTSTSAKPDNQDWSQIQRLKDRVSRLTQEKEHLQRKLPPRTDFGFEDDSMTIKQFIRVDGKEYSYSKTIEFGEVFQYFLPLTKQIMAIAKGASLGYDIMKRQEAHVIGPNGKPTKDLLKDEEGKQVYLPNSIDRLKATFDLMASDPDCKKSLQFISKVLQDTDSLKERAHCEANIRKIAKELDNDSNAPTSDRSMVD